MMDPIYKLCYESGFGKRIVFEPNRNGLCKIFFLYEDFLIYGTDMGFTCSRDYIRIKIVYALRKELEKIYSQWDLLAK